MKTFQQLFAGRTDCYGTYHLPEEARLRSDGKKQGRAKTHRKDLTEKQWDDHLSGKTMLGIVPVMLDGTCNWFAIDIDVYPLDILELEKKIEKSELPLTLCRSKSGGAHAYAFFSEPTQASVAQKLGNKWATDLGFAGSEVFPKQATVGEDNFGNWINIPYFGGDDTDRYAYDAEAKRLSLDDFCAYATARLIQPDDIAGYSENVTNKQEDEELKGIPPCLQYFVENGASEGGRNNLLCQFAIFYKKCDNDNWEQRVHDANHQYFQPPLPDEEVNQIVKNYRNDKYGYNCDNEPQCSHCDRNACLKRKYGIGRNVNLGFVLDRLVKLDSRPPVWIIHANGYSFNVTTETLVSARKFRQAVLDEINVLMPIMKDDMWSKIIEPIIQNVEVEKAPDEVSLEGKLKDVFLEWTGVYLSRNPSKEDILKGNPYYDKQAKQIFFRGQDFIQFFRKDMRKDTQDRDIWACLRNMGCENKNVRINDENVLSLWVYQIEEDQEIWFTVKEGDKF